MKIRTRLTLFYGLTFTTIILIFSALSYWGMRLILFNEIDSNLNLQADSVIQAFPDALSMFQNLDGQFNAGDNAKPFGIEVLRADGKIVYRSEVAKSVNLDLVSSRIQTTFRFMNYKIEQVRETVTTKHPVNGAQSFRVLMKKFYYKDNFVGWIQVLQPVDNIKRQLLILKKVLLTTLLFCIIMIIISGYVLSKSSLRPIQGIIAAANRISHSNLSERIKPLENKDEIWDLAETLNSLFDRLENAFHTQKQFISDAAHELRTPLAILRTGIETEINNEKLDENLREKLLQNLETISRLSSLVEKLLLLSRLENARVESKQVVLDVGEMLAKAGEDISIMTDDKAQTLDIRSEPGLRVLVDPDLLYQAMFNLMTNAVKYTPKNGQVKVEAKSLEKNIQVEVSDNGIGIDEHDLKNIFKRFYRADRSRGMEKGYGLGLAITKQIVLMHKGSIDVKSKAGEGTTITVLLPKHIK